MNGIGAGGGADFIRQTTTSGNMPAAAKTDNKQQISDPKDQMDFSNIKSDNGKVSLIINADKKEDVEQLKQTMLKQNPGSTIKADLPIINGFAIEVSEETLGILPELQKLSGSDVRVFLDGKISIPDPIINSDSDISAKMDVGTATLGIDKLWDQGITGKGTTICVIDTGIAQHPDLKDRIVGFKDFVNGKTEAYDDQGHGTHCAGIAAGSGTVNEKFKGAAPEASIVGVKVLDRNGSGSFSDVIKGIQWAVDNKDELGIDVISMSLGGSVYQPAAKDPVTMAVEAAVEKGVITVVAAGNEGPRPGTIGTPGNAPNVITVGAMDDKGTIARDDDTMAYFSSVGPSKIDNFDKPDIVTPGVNITAASHKGDGYVSMSGTSMATPLAAGVLALAKQVKPEVGPLDIKKIAMDTAEPLPDSKITKHQQGAGVMEPLKIIGNLDPSLKF